MMYFIPKQSLLTLVAVLSISSHSVSAQGNAGKVTADGFVTRANGGGLQIGTVNVQMNEQTRCSKYDDTYAAWEYDLKLRWTSTPCSALTLSAGTYVHLVGIQTSDGVVIASELKISDPWAVDEGIPPLKAPRQLPRLRFLSSLSGGPLKGKLSGGAFLEESPTAVQPKEAVVAHLWINGFPLEEYNDTDVRLVPKVIDRKSLLHFGENDLGNSIRLPSQPKGIPFDPPADDKLHPGIFLAYRAVQGSDGHVGAVALTIFPNSDPIGVPGVSASKYPQIVEPDCVARSSGTIRYEYGEPIQILPDRDVQGYVQRVGKELIPPYQSLSGQVYPVNITFRVFVVDSFENARKNEFVQIDGAKTLPVKGRGSVWKGLDSPFVIPTDGSQVNRIVEMPDGLILIPDVALTRFHNEAQLAFALSAAIQSTVQRREYLAIGAMNFGSGEYAVPPSEISYIGTMQTLRLGIRQMFLAGYDIREAPFAWKYEWGEPVTNPVINSTHPDSDFPWYSTYGFHYISQYYSDVDYSKLKKGEADYAQFLNELRKADPEAFDKK